MISKCYENHERDIGNAVGLEGTVRFRLELSTKGTAFRTLRRMEVRRRAASPDSNFYSRTISAQLHALGAILFVVGAAHLLPAAARSGPGDYVACWIFVSTGFLVFATSGTYHFLHDGFTVNEPLEHLLENLDHSCIYLFIAGTYTPVLLNAVGPPWRTPLLVAIWVIAIFGLAYTFLKPKLPRWMQHKALYTSLFVAMGWLLILRIGEVVGRLTSHQLWFLALGALSYTLGALAYATQRPVLFRGVFGFHELWHLMVVGGAVCHYVTVSGFYR